MPHGKTKQAARTRNQTGEPQAIDFKVIFVIMTVIGCSVFLWNYMNAESRQSEASSTNQRQIITIPTGERIP